MAITIDKRVFAQFPTEEEWSERAIIRSSVGRDAVVEALQRVVARAMTLSMRGVEASSETDDDLSDPDTPNYANYTVLEDGRVELYVDCQGRVGLRRSRALRRILREELRRSGVTSASVEPSADDVDRFAPDAPDAPEWVRFADAALPGLPDVLRPADVPVIHEDAMMKEFATLLGFEYTGAWRAMLVFATELDRESVLNSLLEEWKLRGIDPKPAITRNEKERFSAVRFSPEWGDVEVLARDMKGSSGRPGYLRGVKSPVIVAILSIQSPPQPTA